jgi:hypothetical protein
MQKILALSEPYWRFLTLSLLAVAHPISANADVAALAVVGPSSGSAFSNIGAIPKGLPLPSMSSAVVTIVLKPGPGEDLIADCNASFTMESGAGEPQPIIVGFPVTGQGAGAVKVSSFAVVVNGKKIEHLLRGPIRFPNLDDLGKGSEAQQPTFEQLMQAPWIPDGFPFGDGCTYPYAYYWRQIFPEKSATRVDVSYQLTLHPQSLRYEKRVQRGGSWDVVPFDLMWAGESNEKAYFFDYVLRSGATWNGPIGHETVTLIADPDTKIDLSDEAIFIVGRNVARYINDDTRQDQELIRAGIVTPDKIRRAAGKIVWEINGEKPTQDILVQIPLSLRKLAPNK